MASYISATYAWLGVRPAFYLNPESVLFTSAAAGGKSETAEGGFATIFSEGDTWKLTLLDDTMSVMVGAAEKQADGSYQVSWSNASDTGSDVWLSAIITDGAGEVIDSYAKLAQVTNQSGTATFQLPDGVTPENGNVQVFLEQCSTAATGTDYASQPQPLTFKDNTLTYGDWTSDTANHWRVGSDGSNYFTAEHAFTDWVDNRENCAEVGTKSRYCTVCGRTETENVSAGTHSWETHAEVSADCENGVPGMMAYWECTVCGGLYKDEQGTQKADSLDDLMLNPAHDYNEYDYKPSADGRYHQRYRTCRNCGASSLADSTWLPHKGIDCQGTGTCTDCGYEATSPLQHLYVTNTSTYFQGYETEPTCTEAGTALYKCANQNCSEVGKVTIAALGHLYGTTVPITAPDYDLEGSNWRICTRCNVDDVIPVDALEREDATITITGGNTVWDGGAVTAGKSGSGADFTYTHSSNEDLNATITWYKGVGDDKTAMDEGQAPTEPGQYTLEISTGIHGQWKAATAAKEFTIEKAVQTPTFTLSSNSVNTQGKVTITDQNTPLENAAVTYSSSDSSVAEIDETTGEITIKKEGSVTFTRTFGETAHYQAATSAPVSLTVRAYNNDVDPPALTVQQPTSPGGNGVLQGLDADTMEIKGPDDSGWRPITAEDVQGLKPGTYEVRYSKTADSDASDPAIYTIRNRHAVFSSVSGEKDYVTVGQIPDSGLEGDSFSFTVTPDRGYTAAVSVNGTEREQAAQYNVTVSESIMILVRVEKATYEVWFDTNGATGNNIPARQLHLGDQYGELPVPVYAGRKFVAWHLNDVNGDVITAESTVSIAADHKLVAEWEDKLSLQPAMTTETFDYDGNSHSVTPKASVQGDDTGTLVTEGFKVEYKLKDADDSTYTTTAPSAAGIYTVRISREETEEHREMLPVTGEWLIIQSKDISSVAITGIDAPAAGAIPDTTATVTGAACEIQSVSWNNDGKPFGNDTAYTVTVVLQTDGDHKFVAPVTATVNGQTAASSTVSDDGRTLTVTYTFGKTTAADATITFSTLEGTFEDGSTSKSLIRSVGSALSETDFPTITDTDAKLEGWAFNGQTKTAAKWAEETTSISGDMQFVAVFEGKVTVSFDTMGGTWTIAGQQYANGIEGNENDEMKLPTADHIERTGWTFAGWCTDRACTTQAPDTFPGTRAIYYAKWIADSLTVTVKETPTYDGTAKTPALTVMSGTTTLIAGQDYVAVYSDNTNAGDAAVTVYGIGTYAGLSGSSTFKIQKADQTVNFAKSGDQTATYGESFTNQATAKLDSANAKITYSSSDTSVATVDETTGEVTILKAGEVTITATAADTDNANGNTISYKLTIGKATPTLRFENATVSVKTTGTVKNDLTTSPDGLTVAYSSSNENAAKVDTTSGAVTLMGEGLTTITATFAGDDRYNQATANYTLTVDNDAIAYTAEGWYGTYDGQDHGITVNVSTPSGAKVMYSAAEGGSYSETPIAKTDAGTHTVYYKIEAAGYDTVTGSAKIIINKAALTTATVIGGPYTGSAVNATVSEVKAGTLTVPEGSYEVTCRNNINAGTDTATVTITAKAESNFTGTLDISYTINSKQLTEDMVSPISDQPYTGEQVTPTVTVTDGNTTLVAGRDYTVTYGDNNTVGTGKGAVTITGTGNYTGTVTRTFNITNSGTFEVIADNTTLTYDGTAKTPTVTVWAISQDGKTKTQLTENTDYTLTYADNTNAGTASVTVTGKGAYAENGDSWKAQTEHFTIGQAEQEVSFAGVTGTAVTKTYGDSAFTEAATATLKPNVTGQQTGTVTYTTSDATVATVDSTTGKVTIAGAGTATITATAAATANYSGASVSYTLTVGPKDIGSEDVTVSKIADQPYEGLPVTPSFTVTDNGANIPKKNLVQNVDHTMEYTDNDKIGTGKIILTGTGNYTGTKEVTFQIVTLDKFTITVTPAPITIYMGGQEGFDHVIVDENTGAIQASKSLPVPGFLFTLPDALTEALAAEGKSATDLIFQERGGSKQWTVVLYNESATNLYRLEPKDAGQDPVRVQFTNAQGATVPEDHFIVGENVNQELTMSIYRGQVGDIVVIYNGVRYPVQTGESKLTVRGTTSAPQLPTVIIEDDFDLETLDEGKAAVTAPKNTTYTINGGDIEVTDTTGVSLLFDGIIDTDTDNRTEQLENRAEAYFAEQSAQPAEGYQYAYSFQYLDLVDANNGNAWVKASNDVTVYWPLPADADPDTLQVLHFKGLHRDMATGDIASMISNCEVETVSCSAQDGYVTFNIGSAGFSPFALVWQTKIPYTITATAGSGGSIDPSGATVLHGDSQTFTIAPNSGYRISDVLVDGASVGAVSTYTFDNVTDNHTISVTFQSIGGNGGTTGYTITASAGEGGSISPIGKVSVTRGSDRTFTITPDEGYEIEGVTVDGGSVGAVRSYTFENVRKNHTIAAQFVKSDSPNIPGVADPDDTGVAGWLNTEDHIAFLGGYGGGEFGPDDEMTRAQAAQMFYNLLLDKDVPITVSFTDVSEGAWYAKAVNTLGSLGIIVGVGNDQYAPDRPITRAEFTVIAMRFAHLEAGGTNPFSDVSANAWYCNYVVGAVRYGWIGGYGDGTFRPDNTITRAEVTTIVNRMLGRSADKDYVDAHRSDLTQFTDVTPGHWAYYTIMEATNAHAYTKEAGGEDWTRLQK